MDDDGVVKQPMPQIRSTAGPWKINPFHQTWIVVFQALST
jgi:hypothetical protein